MDLILLIGSFIGCMILGMGIERKLSIKNEPKSAGTLQVYLDDEYSDEPPYFFLDLDESLDNICDSQYVIFSVNINHVDPRR
ncbi:MAG: hypothetical protein J6B01_04580 [Ruminococcus sp.]|nr:hypothetical protein [Ruminococcus sp.]